MANIDLIEFVRIELNESVRRIIFQGMLEGVYCAKEILELTFNKYSIEINFRENSVKIYDDIFAEDEPAEMDIKSFFDLIKEDERD